MLTRPIYLCEVTEGWRSVIHSLSIKGMGSMAWEGRSLTINSWLRKYRAIPEWRRHPILAKCPGLSLFHFRTLLFLKWLSALNLRGPKYGYDHVTRKRNSFLKRVSNWCLSYQCNLRPIFCKYYICCYNYNNSVITVTVLHITYRVTSTYVFKRTRTVV